MSEEEKNAEALKLERENSEKQSRMLSELFAENVFTKAGFKEADYKDIIPSIIQPNAEATKTLAEAICKSMLQQKKAIEKELQDKIIKQQTKPAGGEPKDDSTTDIEKLEKSLKEAIEKNDFVKQAYYTRLLQEEKNKK